MIGARFDRAAIALLARLRDAVSSVRLAVATIVTALLLGGAAAQVVVTHQAAYTGSLGYPTIIGVVENSGASTVQFIRIVGNIYDGGTFLDTASTYATVPTLTPGERSPFKMTFLSEPPNWDAFDTQADADPGGTPKRLEVIAHRSRESMLGVEIVGQVVNEGPPAEFAQVAVAAYGEDGDLVAVGSTYAQPDTIPTGGRASFQVALLETLGEIERLEFITAAD